MSLKFDNIFYKKIKIAFYVNAYVLPLCTFLLDTIMQKNIHFIRKIQLINVEFFEISKFLANECLVAYIFFYNNSRQLTRFNH